MLEASRARLLASLPEDALVVDIGGWADPLPRADWVIDLMSFETRGLYTRKGWIESRDEGSERFSRERWIERDLCDREPYPFADGSVDFVVCGHTLEDLRDPLWVCSEIARIGKAGYIEVPSRLEEQSWGVHGELAGWPHHHWLIDLEGDHLRFVFKSHEIHSRPGWHFPAGFAETLTEEERVHALWWEGGFTWEEKVLIDGPAAEHYIPGFVETELASRLAPPKRRRSRRRLASRRRRRS